MSAKKIVTKEVDVNPFENMNEEKLRKLPVLGKKGLRAFVVKNKILKGISNLKKKQFIDDILVSEWWRDNVGKGKKSKAKKAEKVKEPSVTAKARQKLQNELRLCENRINKKNKSIGERDTEIERLNLLVKDKSKKTKPDKKKVIKIIKDDLNVLTDADTLKGKDKAVEKLSDDILQVDDVSDALTRPDNIALEDPEKIFRMLSNTTQGSIEKLNEADKTLLKETLSKAVEKEIKEPIDKEIKNVIKKEIKGFSSDSKTAEQHGLISHHGNGSIDVGHTVLNLYTNGSQHPDFPIPLSVARQALQAQQLPLQEQHRVAEGLRTYVPESPPIKGIPKEVIPREVSHPSHSSIRSRFERSSSVPPSKKFPQVKPPDRIKKTQDKPPVAQKEVEEEEEEPIKKSAFADDSEEEEEPETEDEKLRKIKEAKQKEIARDFRGAKGKGKTDKFKNRLEGLLGKPRKPPS
jgi:hypothetical protein